MYVQNMDYQIAGKTMSGIAISRKDFLEDRRGCTFTDVAQDLSIPFDQLLQFFNDEQRQRRMIESELHHDRPPLAGVVRELEAQPVIDKFFATVHPQRTQRVRQAIGVLVRMIMTRHGWRKTGRKGSLGIRAAVNRELPSHNKGGLSFWFVRAERYELESGMRFPSTLQRRRELDATRARHTTASGPRRTVRRMSSKTPRPSKG
ncbi:MAG: hypothetical protein KF708_18625 [Pirellulales bacterium]|nr:hypothetical protein [Pirellulales bacterium]